MSAIDAPTPAIALSCWLKVRDVTGEDVAALSGFSVQCVLQQGQDAGSFRLRNLARFLGFARLHVVVLVDTDNKAGSSASGMINERESFLRNS